MYDGSFFFNTINHYNKLGKGFVSRFQVILKDDIFNIKIYSFDKLPNEKLIINDFRYILKEKQGIEIDFKIFITNDINDFIVGSNKQKYFINKDI